MPAENKKAVRWGTALRDWCGDRYRIDDVTHCLDKTTLPASRILLNIVRVHGDSMRPTLCDTDIIIVAKRWFVPSSRLVSRIVVYHSDEGKLNVKRAIGVAGDKVRIERGRVVRNDVLASEDYLCDSDANLFVSWPEQDVSGVRASFAVQAGDVVLVGDNRPISIDSRARGAVAESRLTGVMAVTLPRFLQQAQTCKCT